MTGSGSGFCLPRSEWETRFGSFLGRECEKRTESSLHAYKYWPISVVNESSGFNDVLIQGAHCEINDHTYFH